MPALRGGFPLWLRALARLAALPFPLRVQGREHLVILQEPTILICNHQSYLDALLFTRLLKPHHLRRTFFLAKSRVFETPAGRLLGRGVNALLVDPNHPDQNLLEHSLAILQEGGHLLIFPEGTRSFDSRLGPFSKAFALLAEKAQCPLLPVVIQDAHRLFPRTRKLPRPGRVHIRIIPPLTPPYHHAQTLSQHLHHEMAQHLGGSPESST